MVEGNKKMKKNECLCCKKEKEGSYIFYNEKVDDKLVWVCNDCNHLEKK